MANFPEEILALFSSCPSCTGKSYFLQEQRSCWGGCVWTGWSAFPLGTLSWVLKPSHKDVFWAKTGPPPEEPGSLYFKDTFKRAFTLGTNMCGLRLGLDFAV